MYIHICIKGIYNVWRTTYTMLGRNQVISIRSTHDDSVHDDTYTYIYIYIYIYVCVCICIYVYREREIDRCMHIYIYIYSAHDDSASSPHIHTAHT